MLPDDEYAALKRYQRDTKSIIKWLKRILNKTPVNSQASGPEVLAMAKDVKYRNVQPTQHIQRLFSDAIADRLFVNQYYVHKELDKDGFTSKKTEGHEYYIGKLAEAKDVLFPRSPPVVVPQTAPEGWTEVCHRSRRALTARFHSSS
jgi:hypothetical protein